MSKILLMDIFVLRAIYVQKHCGRFDQTEIIFKIEYPARSDSHQPGAYQFTLPQASQMCFILINKLISLPDKRYQDILHLLF